MSALTFGGPGEMDAIEFAYDPENADIAGIFSGSGWMDAFLEGGVSFKTADGAIDYPLLESWCDYMGIPYQELIGARS
ncbi:hypothetical protein [Acidiphilium acidophilum]|uniref:Uncharacterized protein n=1 Tax=Acidiphilium acidophilum TaxID=76588 RepID=A0AAW9DQV1_ACIAO|nr:hypothetical protein [Acidiphilium acidophilum]MDX5931574.1 hypothetical protein [Acidiphilium acidophilum]